jgi:hypothetical protein
MVMRIQFRRGTHDAWELADTFLAEGELGLEIDTGMFKVGDGINTWNDLDYSSGPSGPRGSTWFDGNGAPGAVSGALPGDYYLDNGSGNVYKLA